MCIYILQEKEGGIKIFEEAIAICFSNFDEIYEVTAVEKIMTSQCISILIPGNCL